MSVCEGLSAVHRQFQIDSGSQMTGSSEEVAAGALRPVNPLVDRLRSPRFRTAPIPFHLDGGVSKQFVPYVHSSYFINPDSSASGLDDFHLFEPTTKTDESILQARIEKQYISELKQDEEVKMCAFRFLFRLF